MISLSGDLLLVGCGKMGGAMLRGWLDRGLSANRVVVVEPNPDAIAGLQAHALTTLRDAEQVPANFAPEVVVLAVKPQMMREALRQLRGVGGTGALFLSIAAGKTIGYFERHLGGAAAIVRAMPNTPAAVGRGITVACANGVVSPAQRELSTALLGAVGEVAWVDEESLIDAVTAVSGGGPAYVFLLIECLAEAGVAAGLPAELAMRLARTTVAGSGELARVQADVPVAQLRQAVMSPGGTTIEAIKVLTGADGLAGLMTRAVAAATRRSRELAD